MPIAPESRPRLIAAAVGVIPIALFVMASRRSVSFDPSIISQKLVKRASGPPAVEITFLPPTNLPKPEPDEDYSQVNYRVIDRTGHLYGGQISSIGPAPVSARIDVTYGHTPDHPRLETYLDGHLRGSTPLAPFPPGIDHPLDAKPDPRIQASLGIERSSMHDPFGGINAMALGIIFRTSNPLGPDEVWRIHPLETTISSGPAAALYFDAKNTKTLMVPEYATDVRAVRVRVERCRRVLASEDLAFPPLRLKRFGAQTDFDVPQPTPIPNHLGLDLILLPRAKPSYNDRAPKDEYSGALDLRQEGARYAVPTSQSGFGPMATVEQAPNELMLFASITEPAFQSLGLQLVQILGHVYSLPPNHKRATPPDGPIHLKVRLQTLRWQTIETFETTIPVAAQK